MSLRDAMALFDELVDTDPRVRDATLAGTDPTLAGLVRDMLRADAASRRVATGVGGEWLATDIQRSEAAEALPDQVGDYEIVRELGQGGMGRVFEAWQRSPRRRVALKIIHPWLVAPTTTAWLREEAEALGAVQHPAIPQVYALEEADGLWFVVMELVDGSPLRRAIAELDRTQRLRMAIAIGEGVAHAHGRGLLHLDLKPDNVRVTPDGRPKVLDFGLARPVDAPAQETIGGTPGFMAPEQRRGERLDTRADVFGFARLVQAMLQGTAPHADLTAVLDKASAKERDQRYSSVEAVVADLTRFVEHRPVHARPASPATRLWLSMRRAPVVASAIAVTSVVLVIATGVSFDRAARAEQALQDALEAEAAAEAEAARAEQTTAFLTDVFLLLNPNTSNGERSLLDATLTALERLDEGALDGAPHEAAQVRVAIAEGLWNLGRGVEAEAQILAAIEDYERLDLEPDETLADALHSAAIVTRINRTRKGRDYKVEMARAWDFLSEAIEVAEALDSQAQIAEMEHSWGVWQHNKGDFIGAKPVFERSIARKRELLASDGIAPMDMVQTLDQLAYMHMMTGEFNKAEACLAEALRLVRSSETAPHPRIATVLHWQADLALHRGDPAKALRLIDQVTAMRDAVGQSMDARSRSAESTVRGRAYVGLGRWEEAEAEIRDYVRLDLNDDPMRLTRDPAWTLARAHLGRGDEAAARDVVMRAYTHDLQAQEGTGSWAWAYTIRARLRAELGEDGALDDIDKALSVWEPRFTASGPRAAGLIALRDGLADD